MKTNKIFKSIKAKTVTLSTLSTFIFTAFLIALPGSAFADTAQTVAQRISGYLGSFAALTMGVFFLLGIVFGGLSLLKFKAHTDDPRQNNVKTPIMYAFVSAGLIGLGYFISTASGTLNGGAGSSNSIQGTQYQSIQ